ncbi:hypothetical protein [Bradyrhizobium sp. STM 3566]|uniref:hypothetical protein n=1 Tax=Bradyrhizobium sp. STM 3566 TaxID=578928 RepID=UPI00388F2E8B
MTGDRPLLRDMLNERLRIVQQMSAAQSRSLLNRQLSGGAEFEMQRIESEIAAMGGSLTLSKAFDEARERFEKANAAVATCEAQCVALEAGLEDVDRRIAADK